MICKPSFRCVPRINALLGMPPLATDFVYDPQPFKVTLSIISSSYLSSHTSNSSVYCVLQLSRHAYYSLDKHHVFLLKHLA